MKKYIIVVLTLISTMSYGQQTVTLQNWGGGSFGVGALGPINYTVQYRTNLMSGSWAPVQARVFDSNQLCGITNKGDVTCFYRTVEVKKTLTEIIDNQFRINIINELVSMGKKYYPQTYIYDIEIPLFTNFVCQGCMDITGIKQFVNMTNFDCSGGHPTMDLAGMSNLVSVTDNSSGSKSLVSMDVSGCTGLKSISCMNQKLTSVDLRSCTNLQKLVLQSNLLTGTLDLTNNVNLVYLDVIANTGLTNVLVHSLPTEVYKSSGTIITVVP